MATIEMVIPQFGVPLVVFIPREKFIWAEYDEDGVQSLMGIYKPGLKYTLRAGNEKLALKLTEWRDEGKVDVYLVDPDWVGGVSGG